MIKETLKKKQVDWGFFLFWNEFQTEGPPEEEAKKTVGGQSHLSPVRERGASSSKP
jgi:hypothetical protein